MEGIGSGSVQIMTDPDPGGRKTIRILWIYNTVKTFEICRKMNRYCMEIFYIF